MLLNPSTAEWAENEGNVKVHGENPNHNCPPNDQRDHPVVVRGLEKVPKEDEVSW